MTPQQLADIANHRAAAKAARLARIRQLNIEAHRFLNRRLPSLLAHAGTTQGHMTAPTLYGDIIRMRDVARG